MVILGAGIIHKVGPSRVSVELSRELASAGYPTLRFDLSGIGDSPRAPELRLEESVSADVRDAVSFLLENVPTWDGGVCLLGFCSGADNAFFLARTDARVKGLALFDPTVPRTRGFELRRLLGRLRSAKSWMNILSGRSLRLRARALVTREIARPPGYYGLLVTTPEDTDATPQDLVRRGVRLLYILSGGAHLYCNSPAQVAESMPAGFSKDHFSIRWRPDMDHILSAPGQRETLLRDVRSWLVALDQVEE